MSFQLDSIRHIEGKPKKNLDAIETRSAMLVSADSPLELLRRHKFQDGDEQLDMLAGYMLTSMSEHECEQMLAGWGILDLPLIKDAKQVV